MEVIDAFIDLLDKNARLKTLSFPVCSLMRDAVRGSPRSGASFGGGDFFDFSSIQKRRGMFESDVKTKKANTK